MAIIKNDTEQTLVYPSLGIELAPGESYDDKAKKPSKNATATPAPVDTATESTPAVTVENTSESSETVADAAVATPSA